MQVPDRGIYHIEIYRKKQGEKEVYAFFTAVFAMIFWVMYCLLPFISTFGGKLFRTFEQQGVQYNEPTGHGVFVFLWYAPVAIGLFIAIVYSAYYALVLKQIKKESEATWLVTFAGLYNYEKEIYNRLMLACAMILTAVLLPLLSFIPNDLSNGMRILLLYFISFLTMATYGLRDGFIERKWAKAVAKEEKKRKKEQAKQAAKKEKEKQKAQQKQARMEVAEENTKKQTGSFIPLAQLIEQSLQEQEYKLPHFKTEVTRILQEARLFANHNIKTNVEDQHMIERILKEEVPAVLATYEELDTKSRAELYDELKCCLDKIQTQLAARNQGRQNIKKLGAKKVIDIIQSRY